MKPLTGILKVGYTQMVHQAGDNIQPAGTCDRCGTCIKHVFVVTYRDGSVQKYGSECINKILSNAPTLKSLFSKNSKLLIKYQSYLAILSAPLDQASRGQEYYGAGFYFIADNDGKDICFNNYFFHPTVDEKNADHQRRVNPADWAIRCDKDAKIGVAKLEKEIARIESFLGRVIEKAVDKPVQS